MSRADALYALVSAPFVLVLLAFLVVMALVATGFGERFVNQLADRLAPPSDVYEIVQKARRDR